MEKILLAMLVITGIVACGWNQAARTPAVQPAAPIAFQPACAGLPAGYKMDLLRLSERLSQEGRTVVIGFCQGKCGFLVYGSEQNEPAPLSPASEASDSGLAQPLPTTLDGKPVCVQEGEPPTL